MLSCASLARDLAEREFSRTDVPVCGDGGPRIDRKSADALNNAGAAGGA